jgi:hypothetical protein
MDGTSRELQAVLERDLTEASESLNFEVAKVARHDLELIDRLWVELANVRDLTEQRPKLIVQPAPGESRIQVLLITGGIWWSQHLTSLPVPADFHERLRSSWDRFALHGGLALDHNSVDESSIVKRWERSSESDGCCIEFDPAVPDTWADLTKRIQTVAELALRGPSPSDVVVDDAEVRIV